MNQPPTGFRTGETRWVPIRDNERISPNCKLARWGNYVAPERKIERGVFPRYYVKLRRTIRAPRDGLSRYQFIASRDPLVRPLNEDQTELEDPGPELAKPNRNRFKSELGVIYCEAATLKRLSLLFPRAKGCGIEETLVTLCLRDETRITYNGVNTLDLDDEIDDHFIQDTDEAVLHAYSATHMKELIRNQCHQFVKIDLGTLPVFKRERRELNREVFHKDEETTRKYLHGAHIARFDEVIVEQTVCPGSKRWMVHNTYTLLRYRDAFRHVYQNTGRFWYLCSRHPRLGIDFDFDDLMIF